MDEPTNSIQKNMIKNADEILTFLKRLGGMAEWCRRSEMLSDSVNLPVSDIFEAEKIVQGLYSNLKREG